MITCFAQCTFSNIVEYQQGYQPSSGVFALVLPSFSSVPFAVIIHSLFTCSIDLCLYVLDFISNYTKFLHDLKDNSFVASQVLLTL